MATERDGGASTRRQEGHDDERRDVIEVNQIELVEQAYVEREVAVV